MTFDFNKELAKLELVKFERDNEDREPIDFYISDTIDIICNVYGTYQMRKDGTMSDVYIECEHPYNAIDWGSDDEMGECMLCGAQCSWHWLEDEDSVDRVIDEWHKTDNKGLVGKYLDELKKEF